VVHAGEKLGKKKERKGHSLRARSWGKKKREKDTHSHMHAGEKLGEKKERKGHSLRSASWCRPALALLLVGKKKDMRTCEVKCAFIEP
jgi:hypothetical protein